MCERVTGGDFDFAVLKRGTKRARAAVSLVTRPLTEKIYSIRSCGLVVF